MYLLFCFDFFIKHQHSFEMLRTDWHQLGEFLRYLLTEEGERTACDCLSRSGLDDSAGHLMSPVQSTVRPTLF
jgi:hypothetical protein